MKLTSLISVLFCTLLFANSEQLILDLEKSLMAPCCWSGTVYDHGNSEMEKEIEALVLKGKPREEILNYFVTFSEPLI